MAGGAETGGYADGRGVAEGAPPHWGGKGSDWPPGRGMLRLLHQDPGAMGHGREEEDMGADAGGGAAPWLGTHIIWPVGVIICVIDMAPAPGCDM